MRSTPASVLLILAAGITLTGCSGPETSEVLSSELTGEVLVAAQVIEGTVTLSRAYGGMSDACGPEVVQVEIRQPNAPTADRFYATAAENVIRLVEGMRADPDFKGYGLDYRATMPGLLDRYGNESDGDILWLCYTAEDVSKINLDNRRFLRENILDMNTLGQDDVLTTFNQ